MKIKDRIKTTSFWVGLIGAVFLILGAFGVEIGDETASAVINAVCSLLVLFGVVSAPQKQGEDHRAEAQSTLESDDANSDNDNDR